MFTTYDKIILKRISTGSTMVIDSPRIIDSRETYPSVPPDIWEWIQSQCVVNGDGMWVFFGYK